MAHGAEIITDIYCMASLFIGIVVNVVNQHGERNGYEQIAQ
jgi:hypothetical protein